ncbi:MAG TPA: efflux RND transporter periplasmic adaptor subunit, partial [Gammaproteobacteria bacterium]|nr:efflux RND transporter periplasmic adaptor subunit [Gammaproteobacteria bacterium]
IGDRVEQGEVVVTLDDDEARQAVAEAEAELALARAEVSQARADAELARRELERTERLAAKQVASASELDTARAEAEARQAAVAVAEARVQQRAAALERAQVQLGYTRVRARWPGDDPSRLVADRMVDPGDSVAAQDPLLDVVHVDPLTAVVHVPESDYPHLAVGQTARLTTRALPGRVFPAEVARIAPRFAADSRRARVEVTVPNPERALTPGMFVAVAVTVDRAERATIVPREAVVRRGEQRGVYRVTPADQGPLRVVWTPVTVGIETDDRVQIRTPAGLDGRVVTLGQQMLEDGAPVVVAELEAP